MTVSEKLNENSLGRPSLDTSQPKGTGYDIESSDGTGRLLPIEVNARWTGRTNVCLTTTENHRSRNKPERWRLALVFVDEPGARVPRYLVEHEFTEPRFTETTRLFHLPSLLQQVGDPR